ncbi:MAG: YggS family pyridoxal phosphate-dependent enzyme, partial [Chloroflexota bacterium]
MPTLAENYARVCERLAAAARRAGRGPESVRLVAVSKGRPLSAIRDLYELGQRDFGENRVEEASDKISPARSAGLEITWHMIGHIQSRKARAVAAEFDWAHSVDSASLAERLNRVAGEVKRSLPILLECNVSGEEEKYGLAASKFEADPAQWEALCAAVETILA